MSFAIIQKIKKILSATTGIPLTATRNPEAVIGNPEAVIGIPVTATGFFFNV